MVGLGNPGPEYRDTRHNLGFRVIERLAAGLGAHSGGTTERELCGALVVEAGELVLARPQTYMNRSGWAVRCLADRFALAPESCLIVFDEMALPLGSLRLRAEGGPAGHRGLASVIESMQTESVPRLRLGIAPAERRIEGEELSVFVLAPFDPAEREQADRLIERAAEAAECWRREGIDAAMTRFNASPPLAETERIG